ncbi:MAG: ATP-binding protein [Pseudomonadota bacterium]
MTSITGKALLDMPYMIVSDNIIEEINSLFLNLTGYELENILGKTVEEVWGKLLRITVDHESVKAISEADCYMFDINRTVKEITVIHSDMVISEKGIYTFQQKKNLMLEEKFPMLELVHYENGTAVALFNMPDFVLLKSNNAFFRHFNRRFKSKEDINGLTLFELLPAGNKGEINESFESMMKSGKPISFKSHQIELPDLGTRYVDLTLCPVFEDGKLRYIIQTHNDVTETVIYRQALIKKNKIIEVRKRQLELVLETVSKNVHIFIIDKDGNFFGDEEMRKYYFMPFGPMNNIYNAYVKGMYFDENGNELQMEDIPVLKSLKGEVVSNARLTMKVMDKTMHYNMSSTPVFDINGDVSMVIVCGFDITERIKYQDLLKSQKDYFYKMFNSLEVPIIAVSYPDFRIKELNKRALLDMNEYFGNGKSAISKKVIGSRIVDNIDYRHMPDESEYLAKLEETKSTVVHEKMEFEKDGRKFYYNMIYQPFMNTNGEINELLIVGIDVTAETEKRQQMEEIIKMKDEFLCLMSHEFKTPLTVISAAVQTLEYIYAGKIPDKAAVMIEKVKQNVNRELRLIDNLLDITRINAGQLKLRERNLDIAFLTRAITESAAIYARQKDVRITFKSDFNEKVIGIDDEKYERIMLNLLSNAIKYTPKGKNIMVELSSILKNRTRMICIKIKDEGVGIPPNKRNQIFKLFSQVDNLLSREAEGSGIGLYLVKLMVDAMGGEIYLESKNGEGSTFTVMLPSRKTKSEKEKAENMDVFNDRIIQSMATELSDIYF